MGLLSRLAGRAAFNGVPWTMGLGAAMGGLGSLANGGDLQDAGRSAATGAAMGAAGLAHPLLGAAGAVGALVPGMLSTRGDVDAAARKIVMASRGDPRNIERAADLLFGGSPSPDEMGHGRYGRSNQYGVSVSDQAGMSSMGVDRERAVRRAYEMMGE